MPREHPTESGGERRRVTVLFCDLVGSTRLSDTLDPEDYSDAMHAYYDACARVIDGLGGWIADYLGDGLVVYFGYPEAHEDDPVRAVRAGLRLVDAVSDIRLQLSGSAGGLACRVGIETGLVVIGEGVRPQEPIWALGRTVNVAARLQAIGSPNDVIIGEGALALVGGWFEFEPLGHHSIKGIAEPIHVVRVTGETGAKDRVGASFPRNLTPLVDRESELATLLGAWREADEGAGGAVLILGQAGIGKSRLALSLREGLRRVAKSLVILYCSQDETTSPLRPVVEHLEREVGIEAADPAERRVALLETYLDQAGVSDPDAVTLLAEILVPDARPPLAAPPEERRRRAMDLLCTFLLRDTPPRLLIVEDVHWADPSTAELIGMALERVASRRALIVMTTRPEFEPGWEARQVVTTMDLPSLAAADCAELAASVAGATLPREGQSLILTRSGGVPLFVEELTRMVLDSGFIAVEAGNARMQGRIIEESVPGTVYDLLIARLGRLGTEAGVAQLASVLGNEFTAGFLRAVAPEEPDLDRKLERLVTLGVVERSGEEREETFRFSHALVPDAAYGLLLRKRRRELHGRVADVLMRDFPETVLTRPELAAPHFAHSGRVEEAIAQWRKAGERAAAQYALHEAIDHYTRALELVRSLPGSPARARQEIEISFALGPVIQNASGFADPRVGELYGRVAELAHWLESDGERFTFLAYGYAINMVRADYEAARTIATQLVQVASRQPSTARKLLAHASLGTTLFQLGEIEQAMPLLDHAIALYDPARHERLIETAAIDPGALCIGYRAWGEWHLGKADRARRTIAELLSLVEEHPHPFRTATAHVWVAGLAQRMREPVDVLRYTQSALDLAAQHDYEELERYSLCLRGWALAVSGDPEEGVATIRRGLALVPHGGSRAHASWHLAMLAEAELRAGKTADALDAVQRARAFVEETGERVLEPDIWRIEAEILSSSGATHGEVETALATALAHARKQRSLPFELRAVAALHRLRGDDESRAVLAECYDAFDEGSDTVDLIEARALLDPRS